MESFVNVLASRSNPGPFLFLIFIVVGIIVVAVNVAQRNRMLEALQRVAARVGGTVDEGGFLGRPQMRFRIGGRDARIEVHAGSKNHPPYTRVTVDARGRSPGSLHLLPEGFGQSFLKIFGAQDIEIGDAAFDADFVIKATPESLAYGLFSPERRRRVTGAVYRIRSLGDPKVDLDANQLSVQVRAYLASEGALLQLVKTAEEFGEFLWGTPVEPGIQVGEVRILSGGECPVCGTRMGTGVVRCQACQTPHHSECWAYMGRCSTYGCGGKRPVA
jgi:hypothetical protein